MIRRLAGLFAIGSLAWMVPTKSDAAPLPDYVRPSKDFDGNNFTFMVRDSPARSVAAAATPDGDQFVVVWEEDDTLFARRYDRQGKPVDPADQQLVIAKDCSRGQEDCSIHERFTKATKPTRPTVSGAYIKGEAGYQIAWEAEAKGSPKIYRRTLWATPVGSPAVNLGETTVVTQGETTSFIGESEPDVKCLTLGDRKASTCLLVTKFQTDCSIPDHPFICNVAVVRRFFDDGDYPDIQIEAGSDANLWEPKIAIVDQDHAVATWLSGENELGAPNFLHMRDIHNRDRDVELVQYIFSQGEFDYCHRHAIEAARLTEKVEEGYFLHLCTRWRDPVWQGQSTWPEIAGFEASPGHREIRGRLISAEINDASQIFPATCYMDHGGHATPHLHSDPVIGFNEKSGDFLLGFRRWWLEPRSTEWDQGNGGLSALRPKSGAIPQEYWDEPDCGMGGTLANLSDPNSSLFIRPGYLQDGTLSTSINRNAIAVSRDIAFYFYNYKDMWGRPSGLVGHRVEMH